MKERPILFSGEMVRATLDGRKGQTRRLVKGHVVGIDDGLPCSRIVRERNGGVSERDVIACPYGWLGDRLWLKETYAFARVFDGIAPSALAPEFRHEPVWYAADGVEEESWMNRGRWRPSIHMPRWASRITLEVTGVRVERLQDITEDDARAEGCDGNCPVGYLPAWMKSPCTYHYAWLWDELYGKRAPWASNPWVWVIEFRRVP